jgi:hypothetical protein
MNSGLLHIFGCFFFLILAFLVRMSWYHSVALIFFPLMHVYIEPPLFVYCYLHSLTYEVPVHSFFYYVFMLGLVGISYVIFQIHICKYFLTLNFFSL